MRHLEPLIVLFVLPVLVGVGAQAMLRVVRRASLAAVVASVALVGGWIMVRAPDETWNWLAALLVLPLPLALALAAVFVRYGCAHPIRRHGGSGG